MGLCISCDTNHNKYSGRTAKLVFEEDGELQEFSSPVRVSYLIQKYPMVFICNSDDMEFEGLMNAVPDEEELHLGQLYFALPLSKLRRKLQPEEMAALAVKASAALMKIGGANKCGGGSRCRRNGVAPLLCGEIEVKEKVMVDGGRKGFPGNLSVIPED